MDYSWLLDPCFNPFNLHILYSFKRRHAPGWNTTFQNDSDGFFFSDGSLKIREESSHSYGKFHLPSYSIRKETARIETQNIYTEPFVGESVQGNIPEAAFWHVALRVLVVLQGRCPNLEKHHQWAKLYNKIMPSIFLLNFVLPSDNWNLWKITLIGSTIQNNTGKSSN